jgi:hypothetical protein
MNVFTSGYDYEARRKWPKFWVWQVIAVSKWMIQGDGIPVSHIEYDNMNKDAALGYAKLMNDANRRE